MMSPRRPLFSKLKKLVTRKKSEKSQSEDDDDDSIVSESSSSINKKKANNKKDGVVKNLPKSVSHDNSSSESSESSSDDSSEDDDDDEEQTEVDAEEAHAAALREAFLVYSNWRLLPGLSVTSAAVVASFRDHYYPVYTKVNKYAEKKKQPLTDQDIEDLLEDWYDRKIGNSATTKEQEDGTGESISRFFRGSGGIQNEHCSRFLFCVCCARNLFLLFLYAAVDWM
jgi:hypothetical protein